MVRGSVVWVSLDPVRGAEVPKTCPCVVVSRTEAHDISSTVTVVPPSSVKGRAADRLDSRVLCDQVRTVDSGRIRQTSGVLRSEVLGRIDRGLILHLELEDYVKL